VERVGSDASRSWIPYEVGRYVNPKFAHYGAHYNFVQDIDKLMLEYVTLFRAWHPRGVFLDVGGRNGEYANMAPDGYEYAILERDVPTPIAAKKFTYYACDLYECHLPPCLASIIFSNNVLEHLVEPHVALRSMARLLKPGGLLLLRTVWLWRYHATKTYGDYFRYSARGLEYLCTQAGLNPVNSGYGQVTQGPAKLLRGSHNNIDVPPVPLPIDTQFPVFVVCYKPKAGERVVAFTEVADSPVAQHPRFHLDFKQPHSERLP